MTLHITPIAGNAIAELAKSEGVGQDGGLRLASLAGDDGVPGGFDASVEALPTPEDLTVTEDTSGAKVFLDPLAADQLVNATLDLAGTGEDDLTFQLIPDSAAPQDGDPSGPNSVGSPSGHPVSVPFTPAESYVHAHRVVRSEPPRIGFTEFTPGKVRGTTFAAHIPKLDANVQNDHTT